MEECGDNKVKLAKQRAWNYIRRVANGFRESIIKIVTYANTPLAVIAVLAALVVSVLLWGPQSEISIIILTGCLALLIIVFLVLLVCDPKRLQLTGKEVFVRELIQLGDSAMAGQYLLSDTITKSTTERIADQRKES